MPRKVIDAVYVIAQRFIFNEAAAERAAEGTAADIVVLSVKIGLQ